MEPTVYQICVRGPFTERKAVALEGMTLYAAAANTVFTGEVKDQSQLFGLLDRLRDLGLELISLQPRAAAGRQPAIARLRDEPAAAPVHRTGLHHQTIIANEDQE